MENILVDRHIVLIGFMGVGKSTVGKLLAERLNMPFYDTDEIIEKEEGISIQELFKIKGEAYFRKLEAQVIKRVLSQQRAVISTGGGLPCFAENMNIINENSISIKLQVGVDRLVERLFLSKDRPLIADMNKRKLKMFISGKLKLRNKYYNKSMITIRAIDSPLKLVNRILERIQQNKL